MSKDTFQDLVKRRLALYKRNVLHVEEDGIWRNMHYAHILPIAKRNLNILQSFRDDFCAWFRHHPVPLHVYFHHLNSSQALCFNLFYPFLKQNGEGLAAMVKALNFDAQAVDGGYFEFEPDSNEGTNFDFMISLSSGSRIYFEVKYTEQGFGSPKNDDEHRRKFDSIYRSRAEERFEPAYCSCDGFLRHYQILRNFWHLDLSKDDIAVFLIPRANQSLRRAEMAIQTCLLPPFRTRSKIIYIEDLLSRLDRSPVISSSLKKGALAEFKAKYFPE
jgi:hypothetical protein